MCLLISFIDLRAVMENKLPDSEHGNWKSEKRRQCDRSDGLQLKPRLVGCHGSGHTRRQRMGCDDWQAEQIGTGNRRHRYQFSRSALSVGEMRFANPFSHCHDDSLPAYRGANSKCESYRHNNPGDDEINDLAELGPTGLQG